jgi:hypothetical protein
MRPIDSPGQYLFILPQNKFGFSPGFTPDGRKMKLEIRSSNYTTFYLLFAKKRGMLS